ncbi:hypothetical protein AGMMS50229_07160 [Campylobacterota bacterium]|nr:hypothetical protein AGMMS50229_07160 [Campylobacterota bacterium]
MVETEIIRRILEHCENIYATQKRFGGDPLVLSADNDYFYSVAMNLLQIAILSAKFAPAFRAERRSVDWNAIDGWRKTLTDDFYTLDAQTLWLMIRETLSELHGVCFVLADSEK